MVQYPIFWTLLLTWPSCKYTDNVIDFMISKIAKLANSTQYVVQLASCLGNTFDLQTLSTVSVMEVEEVEVCLANAVSSFKKFQK